MVGAVSILFVAAGIALAIWWAVTDQPRKAAGFAASAFAIAAGVVLLLRAQIVGFSSGDLQTIDDAADRATADADAIRDLAAEIEADANASSGRVAAHAAEARRLAAETSEALAKAEQQVAALNRLAERAAPSPARRETVEPVAVEP